MILALDLATVTGWCLGEPGSKPSFGHIRLIKPGQPRARAYRRLREWLDDLMDAPKAPTRVVYEAPAIQFLSGNTNVNTMKLLVGLAEHVEEWAYEHIELREAMVGQVRAHFIGRNFKAEVAKPMTMLRCKELGWDVMTPDEADACALWDYQCAFMAPKFAASTTRLFGGGKS